MKKSLLYRSSSTARLLTSPLLLLNGLKRLRRDVTAGVAPYFGAALLVVVGIIGIGLDTGRAYMARSRLSSAVDAAALVGGQSYFEATRDDDVRKFVSTNFPPGTMGVTPNSPTITTDPGNDTITVSTTATVETTFMKLFGVDDLTIRSSATVRRAVRQMELALVMDNTGSMWGQAMTDMKAAAEELVNLIYGPHDSHTNLWVSLVPYTATVNIGTSHSAWLNANDRVFQNPNPFYPTTWKGCVEAGAAPFDATDDPPAVRAFTSYFYADNVDNDWFNPTTGQYNLDEQLSARNQGRGPNLGCGPAITPLVQSKSTVINAIRDMGAWHRGGTTSNLGLVWGWRTISPRWKGLWGGTTPADRPLDYEDRIAEKVIVLLTDGNNEVYDWKCEWVDGQSKGPGDCANKNSSPSGNGPRYSDYTAYGRLQDFGYTSIADGNDELDERMSSMCEDIKANKIKIYTITFGSKPNAATQALFSACATKPEWYYHAPSGDQLKSVFREIGRQLSSLRLSL